MDAQLNNKCLLTLQSLMEGSVSYLVSFKINIQIIIFNINVRDLRNRWRRYVSTNHARVYIDAEPEPHADRPLSIPHQSQSSGSHASNHPDNSMERQIQVV